jgi:hypothetical protein
MSRIQAVRKDSLIAGASCPGITRHLPFNQEGYLGIRSRVDPGMTPGWHHHGQSAWNRPRVVNGLC